MPLATLGLDHKLYRKVGPDWVEVRNVGDTNAPIEANIVEANTRNAEGWAERLVALKTGQLEFNVFNKPADPDYAAFRVAFLTKQPITLRDLDPDGNGIEVVCMISRFAEAKQLQEAAQVEVVAIFTGKPILIEEFDPAPGEPTPEPTPTNIAFFATTIDGAAGTITMDFDQIPTAVTLPGNLVYTGGTTGSQNAILGAQVGDITVQPGPVYRVTRAITFAGPFVTAELITLSAEPGAVAATPGMLSEAFVARPVTNDT